LVLTGVKRATAAPRPIPATTPATVATTPTSGDRVTSATPTSKAAIGAAGMDPAGQPWKPAAAVNAAAVRAAVAVKAATTAATTIAKGAT
jgi:hypothetical protein